MSEQSTTTKANNSCAEPVLCKMGCGFFVSVQCMILFPICFNHSMTSMLLTAGTAVRASGMTCGMAQSKTVMFCSDSYLYLYSFLRTIHPFIDWFIHSIHIITHTLTQTHVSIIRAIAPPETAAPNASANYRRNKVVMTPIPQLHNRNRTHNRNPLPVFVLHPWKPMTPNL